LIVQAPTTVYNQDPGQTRSLEWREIWYCADERPGTFKLSETHGWWDDLKKEVSKKKTQTLGQYETEAEAIKAMERRIWWLRDRGWIYKRTDQFFAFR
jgi:hypothetical protein